MDKLVNLVDYSLADIILIMAGTLMWIYAYIVIIRRALRNKFVEMPAPAGAANIAWEFVWGFLIVTDLGLLFQWGLRIWFIIDVVIFYLLLKYGVKQMLNEEVRKNYVWIMIASVLAWVPAFYFFRTEGYDVSMGATSAYTITILMAVVFITFFLNSKYKDLYSMEVAVSKFIGNSFMGAFVFLHYPGHWFLKTMVIVVVILNVIYIYLVKRHKTQRHVE